MSAAILWVTGSLALLVTLLAATSAVARRLDLDAEIARKFIHVSLGLYSLTFPLIFTAAWQVAAVCGGAVLLMLVIRSAAAFREGIGRGLHSVGRKSYGEILFALSVALLFMLKRDVVVTYVLPLTILTISDAAAALVGTRYGRKLFRIADGSKSWEGATIFFLTAWIIALIELLLLTDAARLNVVFLGLIVAVYGTLIEAESWQGWDNLFVPLALHLLLMQHLETSPAELLLGAACFVGGIALTRMLTPLLGYDRHTAYVATSVVATIAIASTAWNIVLPIAVFLCDSAVQRWQPCRDELAHLAPSLVIAVISLFWYVVADALDLYTVYSFNLSFAALAVGLLWTAPKRWLAAAVGTVVVWLLVQARSLVQHGITPTDPMSLAISFGLLLGVATLSLLAGRFLASQRHVRLGAAALAVGIAALPLGQP
jgi:dolichol kinase